MLEVIMENFHDRVFTWWEWAGFCFNFYRIAFFFFSRIGRAYCIGNDIVIYPFQLPSTQWLLKNWLNDSHTIYIYILKLNFYFLYQQRRKNFGCLQFQKLYNVPILTYFDQIEQRRVVNGFYFFFLCMYRVEAESHSY